MRATKKPPSRSSPAPPAKWASRSSIRHDPLGINLFTDHFRRCLDGGIAIFPYSEVHLTEAANVSDPESRSEQIRFWENVSRQYRFHDAKAIESIQLQTILKHRP